MPATCVPRCVSRGNMGLSKHGDPVCPHFCPLNENLGPCWDKGKGSGRQNAATRCSTQREEGGLSRAP